MSMTDSEEIPEWLHDESDDDDLAFGSRTDAVIDASNTDRKWYKVDGKVYWFDLQEVSWDRKTDILDDNLGADPQTGEIELDVRGFYRDMMEECIADKSVEGGLATFLKGMKPELGDQLQQDVPQPGTVMDEVEEKN